MPVVIPPAKEQKDIVKYLDNLHNKYSQLILTIQKELDTIQELKTRLISDVVTGKIDVRNVEVPEFEYVDEVSEVAEVEIAEDEEQEADV